MRYQKPVVMDLSSRTRRARGQGPLACISGPAAGGWGENCATGTSAGWSCVGGDGVALGYDLCAGGGDPAGGDCFAGGSPGYWCGTGTGGGDTPYGCHTGPIPVNPP